MLRDVPLVFPISLAVIVVMLFFTGAYAISENALEERAGCWPGRCGCGPGRTRSGWSKAAIFVCPLH